MQDKVIEYLKQNQYPYQMKVKNMNVKFEYSTNNKTFNECMVNLLKQKSKMR